ncbi:MAG: O-antigen ligase family protein [Candidatus Magasanikbacteria bacterium]|jgi:putative inorganic carbon (hco3(-)) transporter|nr:O-antigen ligase family protein [Candidatus Magasanikbacteria bacterium]MBT4314872.1 O-antigen ligase family protein [Candidatus Magasanikbacteria bacterium]MBT4546741.1 O-antigen ligase family protein [Candidatus Magasanikbacteria bacterium]MBT6819650.1 O-antigen ligase family protein [Candidatus Magasanikbacteria bacterium]
MIYGLITIYLLLFTFITWNRFDFALALFFFLLPTYLIRFNIGPLPTTVLEMMFFVIFLIFIIKRRSLITGHLSKILKSNRFLFVGISLFLLATTISIFTSSNIKSALGEWKAFYIEPVLMFLIIITTLKSSNAKLIKHIIFALILSGLLTSLLAIYQHFTGWMVPWDFWQNNETFRVTAWYGFPNGVGLFLAPIWPLAFYGFKKIITDFSNKDWKKYLLLTPYSLFLIISPLAIFYAKSTGALVGLIAGLGILLLFYKKTRWPTIIIAIICLSSLLSFSSLSGIKDEIFFQDRSGQIRLSMWSDTFEFLKDNPIRGAGLASYEEKIIPYHTTVNGEGIEIFHHPHNIFLTMWTNLGILGLVSFILILISIIKNSLKIQNSKFKIYILSSMVVILTMGLVDSPYIKNDLAIFFWLLPALLLTNKYELENNKA